MEIPYAETNSIWVDVKANEKPQTITFVLPENVLPNYLRLDIGKIDSHKEMNITGLNISYLDKKVRFLTPILFLTNVYY